MKNSNVREKALTILALLVCCVALVMYLVGMGSRQEISVIALWAVSLVLYLVKLVKPVVFLEYIPALLQVAAVSLFFNTEAFQISSCIAGIDGKFTAPYVAMLIVGCAAFVFSLLPTLCGSQESNTSAVH